MVLHPLYTDTDSQFDVTSSGRSSPIDLQGVRTFSYQSRVAVTGTTTAGGTLAFQRSNDNTNWDTISSATFDVGEENWFVDVDPEYRYFSVNVTVASGGANIDHERFAQG